MPKVAYLTIDDAPSHAMREKIDFLLAHHIPTIFFCRGELLEQRPEDAIDAIRQGFVIGNHAYDHPYFSDLPLEDCFAQIRRTDAIINRLYDQAGVQRPTRCFRFPYGDKGGLKHSEVMEPYEGEGAARKAAIQAFLRELGYTQPRFEDVTYAYYRRAGLLDDVDWYWTYDVMEWTVYADEPEHDIDSLAKVLVRMDENVPDGFRGLNAPGSAEIILTHDLPDTTHFFVPIMERLIAKGLVFKMPVW